MKIKKKLLKNREISCLFEKQVKKPLLAQLVLYFLNGFLNISCLCFMAMKNTNAATIPTP